MNLLITFLVVVLGMLITGSILLLIYYSLSIKRKMIETEKQEEHYFSIQENFETLTKKSDEILTHVKEIYSRSENTKEVNERPQVINIEKYLDMRGIIKRNITKPAHNISVINLGLMINDKNIIKMAIVININENSILMSSTIMTISSDDKRLFKYLLELNGRFWGKVVLRPIDDNKVRVCFEFMFYNIMNQEQQYSVVFNSMLEQNIQLLNTAKERNWQIEQYK